MSKTEEQQVTPVGKEQGQTHIHIEQGQVVIVGKNIGQVKRPKEL